MWILVEITKNFTAIHLPDELLFRYAEATTETGAFTATLTAAFTATLTAAPSAAFFVNSSASVWFNQKLHNYLLLSKILFSGFIANSFADFCVVSNFAFARYKQFFNDAI